MRMRSNAEVFHFQGKKMVGVSTFPAGPETRRFPAVLLLHGFPGTEKNADIQRELMARGIAGFSLHFLGAWGSEGLYRLSGLVDQARAGLRFMARQPSVDPRRLAVVGASMGGWTAIHLGARVPSLKAVAAIAPSGGPEMVTPGIREVVERHSRPLRVGSQDALFNDCVRSVRKWDPAKSAARMKSPLLLVHGTEDELVPHLISGRILAAAKGRAKLVISKGADHGFLDRRSWLVRTVVNWIEPRVKSL